MTKFYGNLGFSQTTEEIIDGKGTGIWTQTIVEHPYYGDILKRSYRNQSGDKVNNDVDITNEISVLLDEFAMQNFHNLVYVTWMGTRWKVSSISIEYPRATLSVGGVYNGPTPTTT